MREPELQEEITIAAIDPAADDARSLIHELDRYQLSIYPAESNHLDPVDTLAADNVLFAGARRGGELVAIGAIKYLEDSNASLCYGEIKRVYVSPRARRLGLSRRLMDYLENHARARGVEVVRLETGTRQPEAVALYRKLGYRERGPFADYPDDPLSVFMEKTLDAGRSEL